jgi:hypothetical protein
VPVRADRDRAIQSFFDVVPRTDFDDALRTSGDDRFDRLYAALCDAAYRKTSFGTLCRRFGVSWVDLVDLWRTYNTHLGLIEVATQPPRILEDMAKYSFSSDAPCPRCDGIGHVTRENSQVPCPTCDGIGRVRVPGDEHARRLLFEIIGLIGPRRQQVEQALRPSPPARPSG